LSYGPPVLISLPSGQGISVGPGERPTRQDTTRSAQQSGRGPNSFGSQVSPEQPGIREQNGVFNAPRGSGRPRVPFPEPGALLLIVIPGFLQPLRELMVDDRIVFRMTFDEI